MRQSSNVDQAPDWTGSAALTAEELLQAHANKVHGGSFDAALQQVLSSERALDALLCCRAKGKTALEYANIRGIIGYHALKVSAESGRNRRSAIARISKNFKKTMRRRARVPGKVESVPGGMIVGEIEGGERTFFEWLSADVSKDRLRPIGGCHRIVNGISMWDLEWLGDDGKAVVVYERHAGRVSSERPECCGKPLGAFMQGVVRTKVLPTAVSNEGDHYVLVGSQGAIRFLSVEEVARSMGVPVASPVMGPLLGGPLADGIDRVEASEAVGALGRAVHVGVVRTIIRYLMRRGVISKGATYGSAYSGIDLAATAMEEEMSGEWSYEFASDRSDRMRAVLLAAWGRRGLASERCYSDAESGGALQAPTVDVFVCTPECGGNSTRNHNSTDDGRKEEALRASSALDYVRLARPRVVVVENVTVAGYVGPLTTIIGGIRGYEWLTCTLDPYRDLNEPVARLRQYWIGERI